jgi:hypothetical protein
MLLYYYISILKQSSSLEYLTSTCPKLDPIYQEAKDNNAVVYSNYNSRLHLLSIQYWNLLEKLPPVIDKITSEPPLGGRPIGA